MKNQINLQLSDFPYRHELKTRWRDLDAFNHVNNATFLSYIEDARIVFFKRWGIDFKTKSLIQANPTDNKYACPHMLYWGQVKSCFAHLSALLEGG